MYSSLLHPLAEFFRKRSLHQCSCFFITGDLVKVKPVPIYGNAAWFSWHP